MRLITDDALATATIFMECEGEPYEGKLGVAEVIYTRWKVKPGYSDGTLAGTVLRAAQFSGWNTNSGNRIRSVQIQDDNDIVMDCAKAWAAACAGSNTVGGATLYANLDICSPSWAGSCDLVAKIGRHSFFVPRR